MKDTIKRLNFSPAPTLHPLPPPPVPPSPPPPQSPTATLSTSEELANAFPLDSNGSVVVDEHSKVDWDDDGDITPQPNDAPRPQGQPRRSGRRPAQNRKYSKKPTIRPDVWVGGKPSESRHYTHAHILHSHAQSHSFAIGSSLDDLHRTHRTQTFRCRLPTRLLISAPARVPLQQREQSRRTLPNQSNGNQREKCKSKRRRRA